MIDRLKRKNLRRCGNRKKQDKHHTEIDDKIKSYELKGHIVPSRELIKTPHQIAKIRESGKINIAVLDAVAAHIQAGMTTEDIDQLIYNKTKELGGIPAQLGYRGFPKSVCTSINEQVCHGIPSKDVVLRDGDIINVDASTIYNGYFSDSSRMFCIGKVDEEKQKLVRVVRECVNLGLEQVKPWGFLGDIGQAVHQHAVKNGFSVVREFGGHGVGLKFHEDPWVGFVSKAKTGMLLVPGMIFTIEPMINIGRCEIFLDRKNGWTVYTRDGSPSAQWEIMVLVTDDGHEVLAY